MMVHFLGTLNIRCRIIIGIQKGTIILTTTHIASRGAPLLAAASSLAVPWTTERDWVGPLGLYELLSILGSKGEP